MFNKNKGVRASYPEGPRFSQASPMQSPTKADGGFLGGIGMVLGFNKQGGFDADSHTIDNDYEVNDRLVDDDNLEARSEAFTDDTGVDVEQRCFLLGKGIESAGEQNFFQLRVQFNVFEDDPKLRQKINVQGQVN